MRGGIEGRDARSAAQVYVVFGIPAGWPDVPAFEILLRPQVRLGQRRTAEGDARFLADDHDRSGETLLPQGGGGVAPRDAAADDHDRAPADSLRHGVHSAAPVQQAGWKPDSVQRRKDLDLLGRPGAVAGHRAVLSRSRMPAACAWTSACDHRSKANVMDLRSCSRNSGLMCAAKLTVSSGSGQGDLPPGRRRRWPCAPGALGGRAGRAPVPGRARGSVAGPGAPLQVGREGRTELGVGGQARLVGGQGGQRDPAGALLFGEARPPAASAGRPRGRRRPRPARPPHAAGTRAPWWRTAARAGRRRARASRTAAGSSGSARAGRRPTRTGSAPASRAGSRNSTYQCMPLQNGLFCEWPHRQSA